MILKQFLIILKSFSKVGRGEQSKLNGKHVVLGRVVEGMEVIDRVEAETGTESEGKPLKPVAARR